MGQRRLRIGIDAHAAGARKTGNERYLLNLLRTLPSVCGHEIVALVPDDVSAEAVRAVGPARIERFVPGNPLARHAWSLAAAARDLDVLLVQYAGPLRPRCPVVHLVHDVSFLTNPEWFTDAERIWMPRLIPRTVQRGAGIITVSEFSRDEISRELSIPAEQITVAYDGVDPVFTPGPSASVREGTFLTVGTDSRRKNLEVVDEAIRRLRARQPHGKAQLLSVGPDEGAAEAQQLGYLDDAALAEQLQTATALLFPSRYEGFGLPPIEAMACGTPALVADIPVMREVCGDAALFLDPDDPEAWVTAMSSFLDDRQDRSAIALAGIERARRFTWEAAAVHVAGVLERAAG